MTSPTAGRATLAQVAELAGVSVASVSRVLNALPASDEMKQQVAQAVKELNYIPDPVARSLKMGKTGQIALAVADIGNPVYVAMMNAIADEIVSAGYRLVMSSIGIDPAEQITFIRNVNRGYVDGLILVPLRLTEASVVELQRMTLPTVVIGTLPVEVELDNVRADSATGVGLAIEHLYHEGRRHIALFNGPVDTVPGSSRLRGYLASAQKFGITTPAELQFNAKDFTYKAGLSAARAIAAQPGIDAVVCANDLLAIAAMKRLQQAGVRIPEDIALVGIDNADVVKFVTPSLTSVDLGSAKRGKKAAKLLLRRLNDPASPTKRVVVSPRLVVRKSSAPRA